MTKNANNINLILHTYYESITKILINTNYDKKYHKMYFFFDIYVIIIIV